MSQTAEEIVRRGKTELTDGPDLAEGQHVRVLINAGQIRRADPERFPDEGVVYMPATPALEALLDQIRRTRVPLPTNRTGPGRKSVAGALTNAPTWDEHLRELMNWRRSAECRRSGE